jgi:NADPH:quinone reductase-like Zn-dependent oxidoreductase
VDAIKLIHRSQAVLGFHLRAILGRPDRIPELASRFLPWVADGSLRPQVGHVLRMEDIRAAHELLASRARFGKIVITL